MHTAGQRQNNDSQERIEPVCLNDNSGTIPLGPRPEGRHTAIPLPGNDNNGTAASQPRSSQASELTRSQNSDSVYCKRPPGWASIITSCRLEDD